MAPSTTRTASVGRVSAPGSARMAVGRMRIVTLTSLLECALTLTVLLENRTVAPSRLPTYEVERR